MASSSNRDQLLKAFIASGKNRRKRKAPFAPDYPSGGRNLMSVSKGRSDANMPLYRARPSEPPSSAAPRVRRTTMAPVRTPAELGDRGYNYRKGAKRMKRQLRKVGKIINPFD